MADADPNALYEYGQTGTPTSWTQNLMGLGYVPKPFAPQEEVFQNQIKFQQILKRILDAQIGAFSPYGVGDNTAMLPYNLRNMFAGASSVMNDPMYGIVGAPGFFGGGWKQGELPNNRSAAYENWWQSTHGYPDVKPPNPVPSAANTNQGGGGGGGGSAPPNQNKQFTVGLQGGGSMTVNAKDAASAVINASQGGNTPDPSKVKQGAYQQF